MMTDRRYYLDDYSDEIVPCDCTLDGWAKWLSKPDADWGRDAPAADGEKFPASVTRFEEDVIATPVAGGEWIFDREPRADFLAVRFAKGMGWSAENICEDWGGVRELLAEDGDSDGPEYIAVGHEETAVIVTYHIGGFCTVAPK